MDFSDSSSEDECNLYVNAASKLNALNRRGLRRIKDDDDDYNDIVDQESNCISSTENGNMVEKETAPSKVYTHSSADKTELETIDLDELISGNDVITCLDDDNDDVNKKRVRTTRNSNKRKENPISLNLDVPVVINDSIEYELNDTQDDSLDLTQDENDSYVVIGSPPPTKKSNTDDYEVSIKVLWKSNKVERFEIKRSETFQKVFRHFANMEGVHEDQILITKKDKRISPFDTPISINWSIIDILDGGIVSPEIVKKTKTNSLTKVQENTCQIKIQTSDKRTLTLSLNNDEPFTNLLKKCSQELKVPETKIRLYFDGELIDEEETPESLDIDEEACVDLKIIK